MKYRQYGIEGCKNLFSLFCRKYTGVMKLRKIDVSEVKPDILDEIQHRKELRMKPGRPTAEDKYWLQTHKAYSDEYGYPYLTADIIEIPAKKEIEITVRQLYNGTSKKITPVFEVAQKTGFIMFKGFVMDVNYKVKENARIRVFCPSLDSLHSECRFVCKSDIGQLRVSYKVSDPSTVPINLYSGVNPGLCMLCRESSENKRVYMCTVDRKAEIGDYRFSVEWK